MSASLSSEKYVIKLIWSTNGDKQEVDNWSSYVDGSNSELLTYHAIKVLRDFLRYSRTKIMEDLYFDISDGTLLSIIILGITVWLL